MFVKLCVQKNKTNQGQTSASQYPLSVFADLLPRDRHPHLVFEPHQHRYRENNEALYKIHKKKCEYPRVIDWNPLNVINYSHKIRKAFTQGMRYNGELFDVHDFENLIAIREPIYEELVMEFLATLEMYIVSEMDEKFLVFKLGGVPRSLTLRQVAASLGIYTDEEFESDWFDRYIMTGARLDEGECNSEVWARFSDTPYLSGKNLAKSLKSPKYNVIQKMLSHTLTLRGANKEKVTLVDLWFLHKLKSREKINLPYAAGKFLHAYASRTKPQSKLCGGHFITQFAKSLKVNLRPRNHPYTLVEDPGLPVGIEMYCSAKVARRQGGMYIPFAPTAREALIVPRSGARAKGPASQHASEGEEEEDDDEEEAEDEEDEEQVQRNPGQNSQAEEPSYWQGFMKSFDNMRIEQDRRWQQQEEWHREQVSFMDESRYDQGANRYQNDWLIHNHERLGHRVPNYDPTPLSSPTHLGCTWWCASCPIL